MNRVLNGLWLQHKKWRSPYAFQNLELTLVLSPSYFCIGLTFRLFWDTNNVYIQCLQLQGVCKWSITTKSTWFLNMTKERFHKYNKNDFIWIFWFSPKALSVLEISFTEKGTIFLKFWFHIYKDDYIQKNSPACFIY